MNDPIDLKTMSIEAILHLFDDLPQHDGAFLQKIVQIHRRTLSPVENNEFTENLASWDPDAIVSLARLAVRGAIFTNMEIGNMPSFMDNTNRKNSSASLTPEQIYQCGGSFYSLPEEQQLLILRHTQETESQSNELTADAKNVLQRINVLASHLIQGNDRFNRAMRAVMGES